MAAEPLGDASPVAESWFSGALLGLLDASHPSYLLSRGILSAGGGLLVLVDSSTARSKVAGVLLEITGALCFLGAARAAGRRAKRRNQKVAKIAKMAPPERYADLQAAMARLHEAEDRAHRRRIRPPE